MTAALVLAAALLGAAWRRWLGSERPGWAPDGYRFMQIAAGIAVLFGFCRLSGNSGWFAAAAAALAIGFMTLPIAYSRRPFVWLARRLNLPTTDRLPHPWRPMLQGPEPWGEAFQGAALWMLAVSVR